MKSHSIASRLLGYTQGVLPATATAGAGQPEDTFAELIVDERLDELDQVRTGYLEDMLATTLTRVDELEQSERSLHAECDTLRRQVSVLSERFNREVQIFGTAPHRAPPGGFDGAAVRLMSITRRRDAWLTELSSHGVTGPAFALCPHDGLPGPLAILVWGSGGIGDILYSTTILKALARQFTDCTLIVLHENGKVGEVLEANPYISGTIWLEGAALYSFVRICHSLDIFDLIVEVKYAVTYSAPPLSRAPLDFVRPASYRAAEWQTYVRYRWPHLNNLFANEVMARGMTKLDLIGWTSMLPIDHGSPIEFFVDFADHVGYPELRGLTYITIHHGSDKRMASATGRQTKNLPVSTWNEFVPKIKAHGYAVVQLGELHEELVAGVDFDFRGRTPLERTAYVLKTAAAHVDTEGGIVHLARAVNTDSVVAFGPTPAGFFGYPDNINIAPPVCGNCWWTSDTWSTQCPRGLAGPECMMAHSADTLADATLKLASRSQVGLEITSVTPVADTVITPADEARLLTELAAASAQPALAGALVIGPQRRYGMLGGVVALPGAVQYLTPSNQFRAAQHAFGDRVQVSAYAAGNIPANAATFDWIVAIGFNTGTHSTVSTLTDLARCLRPGGALTFIVDSNTRDRTPDEIVRALIDTNALRPGLRFTIERGAGANHSVLEPLGPARAFILTIQAHVAPDPAIADHSPAHAQFVGRL